MTVPPRLRAVPPSPSPSSTSEPLLTESDEHTIQDRLLYDDAIRFAADMLEPERHRRLTPEQWFAEAQHRAGIVGGHVFDVSVVGGRRSVLKAREEIGRVVGLYLALDRTLAELEQAAPPVNA